jgi:hypothetical protein
MKTQTLEQRAVSALTADPPPSPAALLTLIGEVESGATAADAAAEQARQDYLDPIKCPSASAGRAKVEATEFVGSRLRSVLVRLEDRYREVEAAEAAAAWRTRYEALERERDQLAEEMARIYPASVNAIADVLSRAAELDRRLSALHGSRPTGAAKGYLLGVELTARQLDAFTRDQPSLTRELRLPDWVESCKLAYPAPTTPASVMIAETVSSVHDRRRHSSLWPEALREENARRVAEEQKRIEQEQRRVAADKAAYEASLPR